MNPRKTLLPCYLFAALLVLINVSLPGIASGATHWVSPTGSAAWGSCVGNTALSGTAACSLSTANNSAAAGDLVYLRAGTYSSAGIVPSNSGTGTPPSGPWNRITFMGYTGETPNITYSSSDQINLTGRSYIRISGITFTKTSQNTNYRLEAGSHHNEIDHDTFNSPNGYNMSFLIDGTASNTWSTHNWIHDNTFSTSGQASGNGGLGCTDGGGDTMDIGVAFGVYSTTGDNDNNNTVENNVFAHAPHANFETFGLYTVFRNNVLHNEPWSSGCASFTNSPTYTNTTYNGKFGHRNLSIDNDYTARTFTHTLMEGNRSGYAGINQDNDGADNYTLGGAQDIIRYNFGYASMSPGFLFKWGGWNSPDNSGGHVGYSRLYNNTLYDNGIGYNWGYTCTLSTCPFTETQISLYAGSTSADGMVLKNNLMYGPDSLGWQHFGGDALDKGIGGIYPGPFNAKSAFAYFAAGNAVNNWCTGTQTAIGGAAGACSATGDPKFTNPDISNPASQTLPNLSLQSTSPAIDGGTFLTTATNAGTNSTSLTVADALYFQDGTWGSDLSRASAGLGGTMQADWIAIGSVSNAVQISSISYGAYNNPAGTITLAAPSTWSTGAKIWLYKKSDGKVVLSGAAPDYGASEFIPSGTTVAPPTNPKTVVH